MNRLFRARLCLVVLLVIFLGVFVSFVVETVDWLSYTGAGYDHYDLVYSYEEGEYERLYSYVVVNDYLGKEREQYSYFALYYHYLSDAYVAKENGLSYASKLEKANEYRSAIYDPLILRKVEKIESIYAIH